jgi:hypothetical protein
MEVAAGDNAYVVTSVATTPIGLQAVVHEVGLAKGSRTP